ncbi:golgin subfamily A member 6-like protein 22 [Palaemon carinicauda]|uniref:golgin subfamily A member 6-like protein 22 n=1 Tax=Palaemon carinicauda TaxID=392227 RepID=UPI0035B5E2E4
MEAMKNVIRILLNGGWQWRSALAEELDLCDAARRNLQDYRTQNSLYFVRGSNGGVGETAGDAELLQNLLQEIEGETTQEAIEFHPAEGEIKEELEDEIDIPAETIQEAGEFHLAEREFKEELENGIDLPAEMIQEAGEFPPAEGEFQEELEDGIDIPVETILEAGEFHPAKGEFQEELEDGIDIPAETIQEAGEFHLAEREFKEELEDGIDLPTEMIQEAGEFPPAEGEFQEELEDGIDLPAEKSSVEDRSIFTPSSEVERSRTAFIRNQITREKVAFDEEKQHFQEEKMAFHTPETTFKIENQDLKEGKETPTLEMQALIEKEQNIDKKMDQLKNENEEFQKEKMAFYIAEKMLKIDNQILKEAKETHRLEMQALIDKEMNIDKKNEEFVNDKKEFEREKAAFYKDIDNMRDNIKEEKETLRLEKQALSEKEQNIDKKMDQLKNENEEFQKEKMAFYIAEKMLKTEYRVLKEEKETHRLEMQALIDKEMNVEEEIEQFVIDKKEFDREKAAIYKDIENMRDNIKEEKETLRLEKQALSEKEQHIDKKIEKFKNENKEFESEKAAIYKDIENIRENIKGEKETLRHEMQALIEKEKNIDKKIERLRNKTEKPWQTLGVGEEQKREVQRIRDMEKRDEKADIKVTDRQWRVYLEEGQWAQENEPNLDSIPVIKLEAEPKFKKGAMVEVREDNTFDATVNKKVVEIGIGTEGSSNYSVMSLEQAQTLGLDQQMKLTRNIRLGNEYPIGILENVQVTIGKDETVYVCFYILDQKMKPGISLGRKDLCRYGFIRKFNSNGSTLFIDNDQNRKNVKCKGSSLSFNVLLSKDIKAPHAKVLISEGNTSLVRSNFLEKKRKKGLFNCCSSTPKIESLLIKTCYGKLAPVKVLIKDVLPEGNGDIVLGTNFLRRTNAMVDYKQQRLFVMYEKNCCFSAAAENNQQKQQQLRIISSSSSSSSREYSAVDAVENNQQKQQQLRIISSSSSSSSSGE